MIGGLMLLCSVAGISLICYWALQNDDLPEGARSTGLFAFRAWGEHTVARRTGATRRARPPQGKTRKAVTAKPAHRARKPRRIKHLIEEDELVEIERELDAAERHIGPRNRRP